MKLKSKKEILEELKFFAILMAFTSAYGGSIMLFVWLEWFLLAFAVFIGVPAILFILMLFFE